MTAPLMEIAGLSKHFGGLAATDNVSLTVREGETLAVIGPNGAGKSTLIAQLSGALASDQGAIRFGGVDITHHPVHRRVAIGLARSFQVTSIFRNLPVLENVVLAVQARSGSSFRFWQPVARESGLADEAHAYLRQVGLDDRCLAIASTLAHGEKRRLELALAVATRPRMLLLDEPMAGMGADEARHMVKLLASLQGAVTLLLVEHDMDVVFQLADRIAVLVGGRVLACDVPAAIRDDSDVRRAYLGDGAAHANARAPS